MIVEVMENELEWYKDFNRVRRSSLELEIKLGSDSNY
jgi:hypothetical protein